MYCSTKNCGSNFNKYNVKKHLTMCLLNKIKNKFTVSLNKR